MKDRFLFFACATITLVLVGCTVVSGAASDAMPDSDWRFNPDIASVSALRLCDVVAAGIFVNLPPGQRDEEGADRAYRQAIKFCRVQFRKNH